MKKHKQHFGGTLVELMIAVVIIGVGVIAVAGAMGDNFATWGRVYNSTNSNVASQSYAATKAFEKLVRQSTITEIKIDPAHTWVEVFYALPGTPMVPDQHAKFTWNSGTKQLLLERGAIGATVPEILCENVTACSFTHTDATIQISMTLIGQVNGVSQSAQVVAAAMLHNDI